MRTRDFAFVSLRYGRSGEEICTGYAMAASGRMQYDYKQTNTPERQSPDYVRCPLLQHWNTVPSHPPQNATVQQITTHFLPVIIADGHNLRQLTPSTPYPDEKSKTSDENPRHPPKPKKMTDCSNLFQHPKRLTRAKKNP